PPATASIRHRINSIRRRLSSVWFPFPCYLTDTKEVLNGDMFLRSNVGLNVGTAATVLGGTRMESCPNQSLRVVCGGSSKEK
ncbi:hypothetical protein A2U01_0048342, partial [Trifolium medium]|nr:hypothetical protein [Trifolium medium]